MLRRPRERSTGNSNRCGPNYPKWLCRSLYQLQWPPCAGPSFERRRIRSSLVCMAQMSCRRNLTELTRTQPSQRRYRHEVAPLRVLRRSQRRSTVCCCSRRASRILRTEGSPSATVSLLRADQRTSQSAMRLSCRLSDRSRRGGDGTRLRPVKRRTGQLLAPSVWIRAHEGAVGIVGYAGPRAAHCGVRRHTSRMPDEEMQHRREGMGMTSADADGFVRDNHGHPSA